ncbi:hypothetical protein [Veronia pacifica]
MTWLTLGEGEAFPESGRLVDAVSVHTLKNGDLSANGATSIDD